MCSLTHHPVCLLGVCMTSVVDSKCYPCTAKSSLLTSTHAPSQGLQWQSIQKHLLHTTVTQKPGTSHVPRIVGEVTAAHIYKHQCNGHPGTAPHGKGTYIRSSALTYYGKAAPAQTKPTKAACAQRHTQGHACKPMTPRGISSNAKKGGEPSKVGMGWMEMGPEKVGSRAQIGRPP